MLVRLAIRLVFISADVASRLSEAAETIQSESGLTSATLAADQLLIEKLQPTFRGSSEMPINNACEIRDSADFHECGCS